MIQIKIQYQFDKASKFRISSSNSKVEKLDLEDPVLCLA
jgi:hypothetical protein